MTEKEKIERAKMYIDKLANGINPIDDTTVPENDVVNNIRVSRCLFFVSDILRKVIEGNVRPEKKKIKKLPYFISTEKRSNYKYCDSPVCLTDILRQLNDLVDLELYQKISYKDVSAWLVKMGILEEVETFNGRITKKPTKAGNEIGIVSEVRSSMRGDYNVVVYNKEAQQFVIDNLDAIFDNRDN